MGKVFLSMFHFRGYRIGNLAPLLYTNLFQNSMGGNILTNNYTTMIRRIGSTTYKVKVYFKEDGETIEDKILRIVRNEGFKSDEPCGIIKLPQMSRQSERSA